MAVTKEITAVNISVNISSHIQAHCLHGMREIICETTLGDGDGVGWKLKSQQYKVEPQMLGLKVGAKIQAFDVWHENFFHHPPCIYCLWIVTQYGFIRFEREELTE